MTNEQWRESTEGDLDPDLTEEAGYAGWDAPRRRGLSLLYRVILVLVLVSFAGGALLVLMH